MTNVTDICKLNYLTVRRAVLSWWVASILAQVSGLKTRMARREGAEAHESLIVNSFTSLHRVNSLYTTIFLGHFNKELLCDL